MSDGLDALLPCREYALSICLASAVAKHTFRDKAATRGPQISPQRMHPRRDDDEGRSSRVTSRAWMSRRAGRRGLPAARARRVAPTAARDDDALQAGGCEYELSVCMASAIAKHSFRDHDCGPEISPVKRA